MTALSGAALPACVGAGDGTTGTINVNLVGQAPSGTMYRLRDATIVVQGPTTSSSFDTEDDPDRTSLSANVVVGNYSSTLQPGWRLERVEGPSTTTVPAELKSTNPVHFTVAEDQRTTVPLRFRVLGEDIDLTQGYDIVLDIEEPTEVEPNEDGTPSVGGFGTQGNDFATANADANGAFTGSTLVLAKIAPLGDEDVFAFENTSAGPVLVRFDLWNSALGVGAPCGATIDTALVIRDAAGAALATNNDRNGGADRCSGLEIALAAGQRVYAHALAYNDNLPIAGYVLQAVYTTPVCGNGAIEPGEQCDDGNTAGGDGCSAICQAELVAEAEPNDTFVEADASALQLTGRATIQGSIATPGDVDIYRLTLAAPAVVRFETFTTPFDCNASTVVRLFDAAGAPIVADTVGSGISLCGALVFRLDAGAVFVQVEESGNNAAIASYVLDVSLQEDRGAESEPIGEQGANDTIATASTNLLGGRDVVVFGDHSLETDVDIYAIQVPPRGRIRAEIIEGDRAVETCESNGVDSTLSLLDETGALITSDYDGGRGYCSLLDGTGSTPRNSFARNDSTVARTMYLRVQATGTTAQRQFQYRLQVTLR
ncbi:MAG TPA: myxococcus cysteine-rich repeat containing protein [Kofleriaceae bacterium]|nr:myxococcus cysteine-rich repeat containing protein [Kofleriaceae bacterium]